MEHVGQAKVVRPGAGSVEEVDRRADHLDGRVGRPETRRREADAADALVGTEHTAVRCHHGDPQRREFVERDARAHQVEEQQPYEHANQADDALPIELESASHGPSVGRFEC